MKILSENLDMKNLCAKWMPRLLTMKQKHYRMNISMKNLEYVKLNSKEFMRLFITVDEIRIHHYTPETKI